MLNKPKNESREGDKDSLSKESKQNTQLYTTTDSAKPTAIQQETLNASEQHHSTKSNHDDNQDNVIVTAVKECHVSAEDDSIEDRADCSPPSYSSSMKERPSGTLPKPDITLNSKIKQGREDKNTTDSTIIREEKSKKYSINDGKNTASGTGASNEKQDSRHRRSQFKAHFIRRTSSIDDGGVSLEEEELDMNEVVDSDCCSLDIENVRI